MKCTQKHQNVVRIRKNIFQITSTCSDLALCLFCWDRFANSCMKQTTNCQFVSICTLLLFMLTLPNRTHIHSLCSFVIFSSQIWFVLVNGVLSLRNIFFFCNVMLELIPLHFKVMLELNLLHYKVMMELSPLHFKVMLECMVSENSYG